MNIGDRAGALIGVIPETKTVEYLGVGTYQGDTEIPPKEAGGFNIGAPNPKIVLDNGDTVWGCECWWGGEKAIAKRLDDYRKAGYTITTVSIHDARARATV